MSEVRNRNVGQNEYFILFPERTDSQFTMADMKLLSNCSLLQLPGYDCQGRDDLDMELLCWSKEHAFW